MRNSIVIEVFNYCHNLGNSGFVICTEDGGSKGPAYGAAILAGVGAGIYSSIQEACDAFIEEDGITECDLKEAEEYEKFHKIYDRFYENIKENLHALYEL